MMFQFAGKTSFLSLFCVFVLWTLPGFPQTVLLTDHPGTGSYEFGQEMARLLGEACTIGSTVNPAAMASRMGHVATNLAQPVLSSDQIGQPTVEHLTQAVAKGIKKAPHQGQQPASSARARGRGGARARGGWWRWRWRG